MIKQQKQKANVVLNQLCSYLERCFGVDIETINEMIDNQNIQIAGGFPRRINYLQNDIELKEPDFNALVHNASDIDIFMVDAYHELSDSSFVTNSDRIGTPFVGFDTLSDIISFGSKKPKYKVRPININSNYSPLLNHHLCRSQSNVRKHSIKYYLTDDKKNTFLKIKKNKKEFENNEKSKKRDSDDQYYKCLVPLNIINESHLLMNHDCVLSSYSQIGSRYYNILNSEFESINVQFIFCSTSSKIKSKIYNAGPRDNKIVPNSLKSYKDDRDLFVDIFDINCSKYYFTKLGYNISDCEVVSMDTGKPYEIRVDNKPLYSNIHRRILKYIEYGFILPEDMKEYIRNKKLSHMSERTNIIGLDYY